MNENPKNVFIDINISNSTIYDNMLEFSKPENQLLNLEKMA